jgi:hypothetical protein
MIFSNFYSYFFKKINAQFVIAFFLCFYVFLPLFYVFRSIFLISFDLNFFIFHVLLLFFLYFLFIFAEDFFVKIVKIIFSDFILICKDIFSLGAKIFRDYPFVFGVYSFLSLSSFHLIRHEDYSKIFVLHCFYCFLVIFRNFFIVPLLGFYFIVETNQRKTELFLNTKEFDSKTNCILFQNTSLRNNPHFYENFHIWSVWLESLKPSEKSVKITARTSLFTCLLWYSFYFSRAHGNFLRELFQNQKHEINENLKAVSCSSSTKNCKAVSTRVEEVESFLTNPKLLHSQSCETPVEVHSMRVEEIILQLAIELKKKADFLFSEMAPFLKMNSSLLGFVNV